MEAAARRRTAWVSEPRRKDVSKARGRVLWKPNETPGGRGGGVPRPAPRSSIPNPGGFLSDSERGVRHRPLFLRSCTTLARRRLARAWRRNASKANGSAESALGILRWHGANSKRGCQRGCCGKKCVREIVEPSALGKIYKQKKCSTLDAWGKLCSLPDGD